MATKYIIGSVLGSFAIAYVCDVAIADKKLFGGKYGLFFYFDFDFGRANRHSCHFIQVLLHILLQTTNGGKRRTKNSRHGLELLVPLWS